MPGSYYHFSFMPQGIHPASRREHKPVRKKDCGIHGEWV
nr:MAG TPA: hypothetical protein [Caudoviricetes sp.]